MNTKFKVQEIKENYILIVSPRWEANAKTSSKITPITVVGNKVKIAELTLPENNASLLEQLRFLLVDKYVDLVNPHDVIAASTDSPIVSCDVIIDKTSVAYYFSDYSSKKVGQLEVAY